MAVLLLLLASTTAFLLPRPPPASNRSPSPRQGHAVFASSSPQQPSQPAFVVTRTRQQGQSPPVLTVALADGRRFALVDRCPPTNHSLLAARVDPAVLALQDPVFGTRFDLRTGRVRGAWCPDGPWCVRAALAPAGLTVVEVEADGGSVEIE